VRAKLADFTDLVLHPRSHPTQLSYLNGFSYGIGYNMLLLLTSLYVIHLEFDLADLGLVVSASAIFMILLRLAGGAASDRFGERLVLWFAFGALLICALMIMGSTTLLPIIIAQQFNGISRSVYWSAGQSYTSRSSEGEAGRTMGRLLSFESTGGILGGLVAGVIAEFVGFTAAFLVAASVNGIGMLTTAVMPPLPRKDQVRSIRATLAPARRMMTQRSMALGHYSAFLSAGYAALTVSLFAAFFKDAGYGDAMVGVVRAASGIGTAVMGYSFGSILARTGQRNMAIIGLTSTGALTVLTTLTGDVPIVPIVLMGLGGAAFGTIRALYPAIAAANSSQQERGISLAVVGLYWAVSMLIVPVVFGLIADAIGINNALYIAGGILMGGALITPLLDIMWRRAPSGNPAPSP
jgi:MFS family permease